MALCCPDFEKFVSADPNSEGFWILTLVKMPPRPAQKQSLLRYRGHDGQSSPLLPLSYCPWCGTDLYSHPKTSDPLVPVANQTPPGC